MPHAFWLTIATTPWWLYLLFAIFIRISITVTQPQLIKMKLLYVTLLPLLISTLFACYFIPPSRDALQIAAPLFLIGILFSYIRALYQDIKALPNTQQVLLPGSWLMFVMIVGSICGRQYLFYHYNDFSFTQWMMSHATEVLLPLYAASIGLNLGQVIYFRRLLQHGPYATPEEINTLALHLRRQA